MHLYEIVLYSCHGDFAEQTKPQTILVLIMLSRQTYFVFYLIKGISCSLTTAKEQMKVCVLGADNKTSCHVVFP